VPLRPPRSVCMASGALALRMGVSCHSRATTGLHGWNDPGRMGLTPGTVCDTVR
jgi:hypothetical protein